MCQTALKPQDPTFNIGITFRGPELQAGQTVYLCVDKAYSLGTMVEFIAGGNDVISVKQPLAFRSSMSLIAEFFDTVQDGSTIDVIVVHLRWDRVSITTASIVGTETLMVLRQVLVQAAQAVRRKKKRTTATQGEVPTCVQHLFAAVQQCSSAAGLCKVRTQIEHLPPSPDHHKP